ncbi:hypothetical protein GQ55_2G239900 [Panicum hallii var. hallii]|uniref:Uncharacterized protein n=1 Tax=Panicum hallii var. hallii TaxID=1504633 RepID=A0A2T7ERT8_9POAL|nr:hypothetical protein GQ55_2G239900 [Panicum hallii var. hallii]
MAPGDDRGPIDANQAERANQRKMNKATKPLVQREDRGRWRLLETHVVEAVPYCGALGGGAAHGEHQFAMVGQRTAARQAPSVCSDSYKVEADWSEAVLVRLMAYMVTATFLRITRGLSLVGKLQECFRFVAAARLFVCFRS